MCQSWELLFLKQAPPPPPGALCVYLMVVARHFALLAQ